MHFLSSDRKHGGHLLDCRPRNVNLGLQILSTLELALPIGLDYLTCDFARDTESDLNKAEN
jgi:acetolactate decarboxylase